jgi:hypothetical protein
MHARLFSPGRSRDSIPAVGAIFLAVNSCVLDVDLHGRTKLAVSRLHSHLLESRDVPGWKNYLRDIFTISRALVMLEREVRDIQMSLLVRISRSVMSIFFSLTAYVNFIRCSLKLPTNANSQRTYAKARRLGTVYCTYIIPVRVSWSILSIIKMLSSPRSSLWPTYGARL